MHSEIKAFFKSSYDPMYAEEYGLVCQKREYFERGFEKEIRSIAFEVEEKTSASIANKDFYAASLYGILLTKMYALLERPGIAAQNAHLSLQLLEEVIKEADFQMSNINNSAMAKRVVPAGYPSFGSRDANQAVLFYHSHSKNAENLLIKRKALAEKSFQGLIKHYVQKNKSVSIHNQYLYHVGKWFTLSANDRGENAKESIKAHLQKQLEEALILYMYQRMQKAPKDDKEKQEIIRLIHGKYGLLSGGVAKQKVQTVFHQLFPEYAYVESANIEEQKSEQQSSKVEKPVAHPSANKAYGSRETFAAKVNYWV